MLLAEGLTMTLTSIRLKLATFAAVLLFGSALAADKKPEPKKEEPLPPMTAVPALSPEEELKLIQLPDGYKLELVLSDPVIKEPVVTVFDGNGRIYVAEMR